MVALFAAKNAGIEVPDQAISKGKKFLLECQDERGGFGYTGNSGANLPRTAIGVLILALDKDTKSDAFKNSLSHTYAKMHALETRVTSFIVSIIQHRRCFEALQKTGTNGI